MNIMQNKVTFNYETMGNSSYLVATLNKNVGLVNYQMQMLANNDIPNILQVSKRQKNEDIQIYYNITSKISLAQAVSRGKIPKQGFLNLINGIISVYNEIIEYQLVDSGLVFDSNYIFIKTGSYEPSLVYLPVNTQEMGIEPIKSFLLELISQSKVEMSNDNFIQVILEALNSDTLNINELAKIVNGYKNNEPLNESIQEKPLERVSANFEESSRVKQDIKIPNIPVENQTQKPIETKNIISTPLNEKTDGKKSKKESSSDKRKNKFLLLQLPLLGVILAASFSGVLNDNSGNMDFINLFAIIMAVGAIDFVLYRQIFKNTESKKDDKIKVKVKSQNKPTKYPPVAIPGKNVEHNIQINSNEVIPNNIENMEQSIPKQKSIPTPKEVFIPQPLQNYKNVDEFESEDTEVLFNNANHDSYLEYYDNGLLCKIKLDKESVIVGKLKNQVDHIIKNTKISRIHAEFICRDGKYFVKDYNSANGTYINGNKQRIVSNIEKQIYNGDKITLANIELTLKC